MAIAIFPILLVIVGALVYGLASNVKTSTLGLVTFGCGMLALAFALAAQSPGTFVCSTGECHARLG